MFGFLKPPKQKSGVDHPEDAKNNTLNPGRRTASEPVLVTPDFTIDDEKRERYKKGFHDSGGLENQSVQELENYAAYKAEETTSTVNNTLRIAENIREDAAKTLDMLHQQGDQITRTHNMVADTEKDLSKGEKLLNNLGGMFSKPWKPKKGKEITGPTIIADKPSKASQNKKEQREKLVGARARSAPTTPPPEPTNAMQKVEYEKAKQDDGLEELSNILGDLKGMAVDMGGELDRQNKALDHLDDDVDELNSRVKGANTRARKLINK